MDRRSIGVSNEAKRLREMADAYKDFTQIPKPEREPTPAQLDQRASVRPYHERKERVVGGTIKWTPVDAVAARVVATAPWWGQAPAPEPKFMKKPESIDFTEHGRIQGVRKLTEDGHVEEVYSQRDVEVGETEHHQKQTTKALDNLESLETRARDIHDSLEYLFSHIGPLFASVNETLTKELVNLREKRFGVDTETRLLMNQLKEVRQFFLAEDHDRQVDRLREFVDLCERLRALKESGFLDTVADTILKL